MNGVFGQFRLRSLSGSFGEIINGKPVCVFSRYVPVSFISAANVLMRRCLLIYTAEGFASFAQSGVPGVISGKFSVRETATKSLLSARHDYI